MTALINLYINTTRMRAELATNPIVVSKLGEP